MKQQKGASELLFQIFICGILLGVVFLIDRCSNPELYDEAIDFRYEYVSNGKVRAVVEHLNWYNYDDVTAYYVFTNIGKLKIDSPENFAWSPDEDMYEILENHYDHACDFYVEDQMLDGWVTTKFENCSPATDEDYERYSYMPNQ